MNKLSRVIALGALLAGTMAAQRPFGVMTSSTPPDPATIVAHQVDRLTTLLGLTTAQAAQATTIFTNALTAITPLHTNLSADNTALQAAVQNNAAAAIDTLSAAIGTLTGQIIAIQNKADAAFYAILTSDQQAKLNSTGGFGGGFGPGPGGPRH
ncbi:MAG: Spy/CpxP family protein refolding chaperone [Acidobacteriota bacterium]|nr:Spy/CpxP family protein refolding chaperone [Acidobacteriota bacterium]